MTNFEVARQRLYSQRLPRITGITQATIEQAAQEYAACLGVALKLLEKG